MLQLIDNDSLQLCPPSAGKSVHLLQLRHQAEVLNFLARRPEHTFVMRSWIRDNGLISALNRGTFYGHRDEQGELDGVALVGHVTLFETNKELALSAFARLAQDCPLARVVMGESHSLERFLGHYKHGGQEPRLMCREQLFEQAHKENIDEAVSELRFATPDDLEMIVPVHAQMAFEESGIDPLFEDPEGFYQRCARRIQQKRVWVLVENKQLVFKADIISDLPEVIYLEGVYVDSAKRGKGLGPRCLKQLTNQLLTRTASVCLLVDTKNVAAQACYRKAGYRLRALYDTLYLGHAQNPTQH